MLGLVPFNFGKDIQAKQNGFQSLMDFFNEPFFSDFPSVEAKSFKVDVKDKGADYELTAELPGLRKEDISLNYSNNYLTISAQRHEEKNEQDDKHNYIRRERHFGSMSRSFYIDDVDDAKIQAEFTDGVLKIDLPKLTAEVQRGKNIPIK